MATVNLWDKCYRRFVDARSATCKRRRENPLYVAAGELRWPKSQAARQVEKSLGRASPAVSAIVAPPNQPDRESEQSQGPHTGEPRIVQGSTGASAEVIAVQQQVFVGIDVNKVQLVSLLIMLCSAYSLVFLHHPPYGGRHAHDPVCNGLSGLLQVSASRLPGTGGARPQTSVGCSPSAAARPSVAWSWRPPALGLALRNLAALSGGYGSGQTGNRGSVAPPRIPQILALALTIAPRWAGRK